MIFSETGIKGSYVADLKKIEDSRGFFGRAFCTTEFSELGITSDIKQANLSYTSKKGTIRGMHFQKHPYEEMKAIRCIRGSIFDVVLDLRPESETFKRWFGIKLSAENYKMLIIPEGCAHGFQTLENDIEVFYLVSKEFSPSHDAGVRFDDPAFQIHWPLKVSEISDKDKSFKDFPL
ncbi:dTDP-4-dehydrorhamnose 3,5-epimerase [Leptospira levettii]|uniref:dTDP-4-dehydrorhamnose 3,5-epimerase n=1 Tax=Leptospira levettii TaxID=2023178 RepID=UPI000C2984A3|nr:dTDP-4-dehydrorhamnose 3,5-epimerase [Leptospira levettii]MCW7472050.1 dTDP-4-dehydrorhamnose 3,5-epimerase [Leptospira levettii]PJZ36179.1 dTDP-4-dehydrorhamnose 3,5-epimerase [Leptospira levettii]PJZ90165.1 dTDP-4-dehydrorhamnose 3,5-epimerase [Leptospira levettii]PJZ99849.1 dTDP-4-dehydrorhamnose 3,5-epimerase [Leptospira levettii]